MKYNTVHERLFYRELAGPAKRSTDVRTIYDDRKWVQDLDIVNELDGHSGCVNALSWSKSGELLASGSDDQHLNIHQFQPDSSTRPFRLATSVSTGHSANIFSCKFMPHSADRTLVTAAGDAQIRVFDIEYSGRSSLPLASDVASAQRAQGFLNTGVQYLSDADTNARVYRSHSDRVKRIVTESSPHLFLSCSEDGEVRQWDLRQPSSAYPRARGGRGWRSATEDDDSGVPPPLISYKRYHLDLNTISCSPSQPHYIVLGGAHLHAFLHDRRMLGRDRDRERGKLGGRAKFDSHDDNALSEATRCVRRFAPNGQRKMKRTDSGHITACKISDANPNEMVVSWSGDYIYSFDLVRTADVRDQGDYTLLYGEGEDGASQRGSSSRKAKQSRDSKKRKRTKEGSVLSQEGAGRVGSKPRRSSSPSPQLERTENGDVALRVRYENGQSENIPLREAQEREGSQLPEAAESSMSEAERKSFRIANASVKIRKHMFSPGKPKQASEQDPTGYATSFTSVLGFSASVLEDMDEIIRTWRYPVLEDEDEAEADLTVSLQTTLRRHRESARRFVQASGTVARLLGGKLRTAGGTQNELLGQFAQIVPAPNETTISESREQFDYDFLKAIVLWLDSGPGALVEGFSRRRNSPRHPISDNASIEAIDEELIPYLLRLAGDRTDPIPNVEASRFEVDANRRLFGSDQAAVVAFAQAIKIPFQDLSRAIVPVPSEGHEESSAESALDRAGAQDRKTAVKFWGGKVARGLLLRAAEEVNHVFIDRAFGGLGRLTGWSEREEAALNTRLGDIDTQEDERQDPLLDTARLVRGPSTGHIYAQDIAASIANEDATDVDLPRSDHDEVEIMEDSTEQLVAVDDVQAVIRAVTGEANEGDDEEHEGSEVEDPDDAEGDLEEDDAGEEEEEEEEDEREDEEEENEDDEGDGPGHFVFRSAFERSAMREHVQRPVPCASHLRQYRGHCNVKTVKDVNFYGLNDEYIVSGSDSGHLFIWDRKSSQLLNILEGDGEVVNVIQGHPYEPMLAVSGIDHTIKVFSADARARHNARHGIGVTSIDSSGFSSLQFGRTRFGAARRPPRRAQAQEASQENAEQAADAASTSTSEPAVPHAAWDYDTDDERNPQRPRTPPSGLSSRRRMHDEYSITSQNDVDRRGGNREAFITRSMLAELAARIRFQTTHDGGGGGTGGDGDGGDGDDDDEDGGEGMTIGIGQGGRIILGDDCLLM